MQHILLVDDDEDMLKLTSRWLIKAGYAVETVNSGKAAMDYLSGKKTDLIILDYAMPEMDGPAVFKAIRSDDKLKNIPVLFRTGKDDGNILDELDGHKPEGIVSKSEGKPSLLATVAEVLGTLH